MLTDLRDKLEPVGRLDVLDAVGEKTVGYFDRQEIEGKPTDERAKHLIGEVKSGQVKRRQEQAEPEYKIVKCEPTESEKAEDTRKAKEAKNANIVRIIGACIMAAIYFAID